MKILLTTNKTYRGHKDGSYWNVYLPLVDLGHDVHFYDTASAPPDSYSKVIEKFKPDIIYCCMTGDRSIAPFEPWDEVAHQTEKGNIKTFNWFCDDTWRFDSFSSVVCRYFNVCSTPEPTYIKKFKACGYNNIILGNWHVNSDLYSVREFVDRDIDISFVGAPNYERRLFFDSIDVPVQNIFGVSQDKLFNIYSKTKIGVNLSVNANDSQKKTQMKQRMFEIPAGGGLLLTQAHSGLEEFFEIDKEIVTFETPREFSEKAKVLLKNPKILESLATAGYKRFLAEHESKIRLTKILKKIMEM
jgi:spore maturation protein CgeB